MKFTVPLRFNYEFGRVYKRGKYLPGKYIVLHFVRHGKDFNRLGITTSKKVKGSVPRNRIRRLMREGYRLNEDKFIKGYDIVLLGRACPEDIKLESIERDILHLMRKSGILDVNTASSLIDEVIDSVQTDDNSV